MIEQPLKVSDLVKAIKSQLENDFSDFWLEGEVSNLSLSSTGHWYFNLSDQDSTISGCLFRGQAIYVKDIARLKDGDKVKVRGNISVYAKRTSVQVIVKELVLSDAQGDLKVKFEKLKAKLASEGLFDIHKKKKIPTYAKSIAIVTAENAAALKDFITVMKRRSLEYNLHIYPSTVQGEQASNSLILALDRAEKHGGYDVIVITRGGGSQEDLWCFNDEKLIRRIYQCELPVVSAIGHEVDYTLCDFVADYRAETPTAAAEILSSAQLKLKEQFNLVIGKLRSFGERKMQYFHFIKNSLKPSYQVKLLREIYHIKQAKLQKLKPSSNFIEKGVTGKLVTLEQTIDKISQSTQHLAETKRQHVENLLTHLNALSPLNVLERGYSIIKNKKGEIVTRRSSYHDILSGEELSLKFYDGEVHFIKP